MRLNRRRQVLTMLQAGPKTQAQMAAALGCTPAAFNWVLIELRQCGVVVRSPSEDREFAGMHRPYVYEVRQ